MYSLEMEDPLTQTGALETPQENRDSWLSKNIIF
jgi:hypothetical protein